jgi:hypothetical protein
MNAWQLLPAVRELYSRLPEMYYRQPWELQHVLFSLGSPIEPRSILARWERSTPEASASSAWVSPWARLHHRKPLTASVSLQLRLRAGSRGVNLQ